MITLVVILALLALLGGYHDNVGSYWTSAGGAINFRLRVNATNSTGGSTYSISASLDATQVRSGGYTC